MKQFLRIPLIGLTLALMLTSCVTQKQVKYLQKRQDMDTTTTYRQIKGFNYTIQAGDNLYIRVYSMDEKSYFFFNRQGSGTTSASEYNSDISLYLNSYTVNDSGYIDFPVVGRLAVKGLTAEQVKDLVQKRISEYLKETSVVVKLVNFSVTLLGEVNTPGERKVYQERLNIFEALSMAGDMTEFADRGKVALIRKSSQGSRVVYLDLNSSSILASEYYYLMPNDIIYVAPLGIKRWGTETFPWALVFSALSTALLLINYFK